MKNLSLVSFVGVDTKTDIQDIIDFRENFPVIPKRKYEFSVLFSETKSLTKDMRYPDYDFCSHFLGYMAGRSVLASIHLCGSVIDKYLAEDPKIIDLCLHASRIQLNLNIANYNDYDKLSSDLIRMVDKHEHHLILQQNKTKEKFMNCFLNKTNITTEQVSLLYDSSGGFGREITTVNPPDIDHFTGYAGGLKPSNVTKVINLIEAANTNDMSYYIDMESGVRSNNLFSVDLCKQVVNNINSM